MSLPMDGVRILSLAEQYPGPFATLVMADLGADVGVDLKTDAGRTALRELIASADVLMEGFRPGTLARLGFGYDEVAKLNPRIVYLSISGFGQNGPYRDRPAHDLSYQAIAGLLYRQAASGKIEAPPELAIGDLSAAMFAVTGCLAALLERTRTGLGQYVDVSMTDGLVSWMSVFLSPAMNGGRLGMIEINAQPAYGVFRCQDGLLLTLSIAHEDWFWAPLCELLELAGIARVTNAERTPRAAELRARIAEALSRKPRAQWAPLLDQAGVPWGPVNSLDDVVNDPHFRARGMFREVGERNGRRAWHVAQPLVFNGGHPGPMRGVPAVGEHDAELLTRAADL